MCSDAQQYLSTLLLLLLRSKLHVYNVLVFPIFLLRSAGTHSYFLYGPMLMGASLLIETFRHC